MNTDSSSVAPWIAGVLLWTAWLVPNHYPPWASFYSESIAVLWAVVIVFSHAAARQEYRDEAPSVVLLLVALSVVPWIQRTTGMIEYDGDAVLAQLYVVGAALCWWAGFNSSRAYSDQHATAFAWTLIAAAIPSTGVALYQWFGLVGLDIWAVDADAGARAIGNIAQSNHLATLLLGSVLATWYLHATCRIGSWTGALVATFSLIGLALAQSRTSWLAAAVVVVWSWAHREKFGTIKVRPHVIVGFSALYFVFYLCSVFAPGWLLIAAGPADARMEVGLRPMLWKQMLAAIQAAPWQGFGWLQIHVAQGAVALSTPGLEYSSYSHNLAIDLLIWNGIPIGLGIFVVLCWTYFQMTVRAEGEVQWLRWAIVTIIGTHAMLEYPHAYAYLLLPMAFLAGQLNGQSGAVRSFKVPMPAVAVLAALATAASVVVMHDYIAIEQEGRLLRMELAGIQGASAQAAVPSVLFLDNMAATIRVARGRLQPGMEAHSIDDTLRVARRYPSRFFLSRAIIALAINDRVKEATVELNRYRGIHGVRAYQRLATSIREMAKQELPSLTPLLAVMPPE